jgi:hypothetical protein
MLSSDKLQSNLHDLVRETLILNTNDTFIQETYHRTIPNDTITQEHNAFIQKLDKEKKEKLTEERTVTKFELGFQEISSVISNPASKIIQTDTSSVILRKHPRFSTIQKVGS